MCGAQAYMESTREVLVRWFIIKNIAFVDRTFKKRQIQEIVEEKLTSQ